MNLFSRKNLFYICFFISFFLVSCSWRSEVTILFTGDINSYIANEVVNENGELVPGLSFGNVSALCDDLEAQGKKVALVDAGNFSMGTAYGSMDNGAHIVQFMNKVGYTAAALGTREFDSGIDRLFGIVKTAKFPIISSTMLYEKNKEPVFKPYKIVKIGSAKVAFVGVLSPETISRTSLNYFKKNGQVFYTIPSGENGKQFYETVQNTIDRASIQSDYVVLLGNLGDDENSYPYRNEDLIKHTHGVVAFIDTHVYNLKGSKKVKNDWGRDVILAAGGRNFSYVGCLTLNGDESKVEIIEEYKNSDPEVDEMIKKWVNRIDDQMNTEIAVSDVDMSSNFHNTNETSFYETNLGDLVADGVYYYLNEFEVFDCDCVLVNSGGIRASLPKGSCSYKQAKIIQPFGNTITVVEMTGKMLRDMLEFGSRLAGERYLNGFLQVAGLTYTIDTSIPSEIKTNLWQKSPKNYRVCDIKIYNRKIGAYEDLDLKKTYKVGGTSYLLCNQGDGYAMGKDFIPIFDYITEDYMVTSIYIQAFKQGPDKKAHISSNNSPLRKYVGYKINYEDTAGSGRIKVKN